MRNIGFLKWTTIVLVLPLGLPQLRAADNEAKNPPELCGRWEMLLPLTAYAVKDLFPDGRYAEKILQVTHLGAENNRATLGMSWGTWKLVNTGAQELYELTPQGSTMVGRDLKSSMPQEIYPVLGHNNFILRYASANAPIVEEDGLIAEKTLNDVVLESPAGTKKVLIINDTIKSYAGKVPDWVLTSKAAPSYGFSICGLARGRLPEEGKTRKEPYHR